MMDLEAIARQSGVTRLTNLTGLDHLRLPVIAAVRPGSLSITIASGKGLHPEQAMVSCVMEAFEHHCGETAALPFEMASLTDARRSDDFADPDLLPLDRRVPRPEPETPFRWVRAQQIDGSGSRLVPHGLVHLRLTPAARQEGGGFLTTTNGLAAGGSFKSAVLHALCEVVERDAISLRFARTGAMTLPGTALPGQGLTKVGHRVADLVGRLARSGMHLHLWDLTCDTGVPVFYARLSEGPDTPFAMVRPCDGSGCDPNPETAICRAITEAAQSRLVLISGSRDDILRRNYSTGGPPTAPTGSLAAFDPAGMGCKDADDSRRLDWVVKRLAAAGFPEILTVQLGAARGALAVRVVVPGLESVAMSQRYVPGPRLRAKWAREAAA